jgi:hypothetical protein
MHELSRPELLITLVHGTWGRGFFPGRRREGRPPFWFEDGSPFLARLSAGIADIPHRIKPQLWSGANSIFERDRTAQLLAGYLAAEHAEHPLASQLIIAHSHGGNIALRALHHLQMRNGSRSEGPDSAYPLVATLATPFVEIHRADFGSRPFYIRVALTMAMLFVSLILAMGLLFLVMWLVPALTARMPSDGGLVIGVYDIIVCLAVGGVGWRWIVRDRQKQVAALENVTRLGELASAKRLLVIRAIDDEASLVLALGTILNYATERLIENLLYLFGVLTVVTLFGYKWWPGVFSMWAYPLSLAGFIVFTLLLFGALMVSRMVHGRELAISPMECQVNTQSAPDAADLSQIVTLVSRKYVKSLRHGIYEHENCASAISDWVRAQLGAAAPVESR